MFFNLFSCWRRIMYYNWIATGMASVTTFWFAISIALYTTIVVATSATLDTTTICLATSVAFITIICWIFVTDQCIAWFRTSAAVDSRQSNEGYRNVDNIAIAGLEITEYWVILSFVFFLDFTIFVSTNKIIIWIYTIVY